MKILQEDPSDTESKWLEGVHRVVEALHQPETPGPTWSRDW